MFGAFKNIAEANDVHYKLWDWLYQNPTEDKSEWPEWETNGGTAPVCSSWCAACEVAESITGSDLCVHKCKVCPIQWTSKNGLKMSSCNRPERDPNNNSIMTGLFVLWYRCNDLELRCNYAKMIRDLEWKEVGEVL